MAGFTQERTLAAQKELEGATAPEILSYAVAHLRAPVFATSLGQEDQAIADMVAKAGLEIPIFTLDTGRLFPETYTLVADTERKHGIRIGIAFPDAAEVEAMVADAGINLFHDSIEARKRCCGVRKVHPLQRKLAAADGWICGLRRDQAATRAEVRAVEWDVANGMPKFNPLVDWSLGDVVAYLKEHGVPYNPLHDQGFASIGCACCTRAIRPGEDIRAGRWWWERPEQKECGLHHADGQTGRAKDSQQRTPK